MRLPGTKRLLLACGALLVITHPAFLAAQTVSAAPVELVRQTIQNELNSDSPTKFMYREQQENGNGSQTKLIVETKDAAAGMLVAIDGKALTPAQKQNEEARLDRLVNNPQELKKKQRTEKEDTERTKRIMKALPEAFLYEPDGVETGRQGMGNPGDELVRLKFRPNPNYDPPSHTEQVLTGMQGVIMIDKEQCRIAKIDGTLVKDVGFGWGILGHLDKGGRFVVQQATAGKDVWQVTRMDLDFTGKILFFKRLVIKQTETLSDFREAPPNLTFAQGVELLKKQAQEMAESHSQSPPANQSQR